VNSNKIQECLKQILAADGHVSCNFQVALLVVGYIHMFYDVYFILFDFAFL